MKPTNNFAKKKSIDATKSMLLFIPDNFQLHTTDFFPIFFICLFVEPIFFFYFRRFVYIQGKTGFSIKSIRKSVIICEASLKPTSFLSSLTRPSIWLVTPRHSHVEIVLFLIILFLIIPSHVEIVLRYSFRSVVLLQTPAHCLSSRTEAHLPAQRSGSAGLVVAVERVCSLMRWHWPRLKYLICPFKGPFTFFGTVKYTSPKCIIGIFT